MADPSSNARAATAAKVAGAFASGALAPRERELATEIFRAMARDVEQRVRETLALHVKDLTSLPRDVAQALARDVAAVSTPVLESSSVLTDQDLIEIIGARDSAKQIAIARRRSVSAGVADALVDAGTEDAVAVLVANEGAELTERAMHRAVDRFGRSERVQGPLVRRGKLPLTVAERLVALVSDRLREHLVTHHSLSPATAADLVFEARERATAGLLDDSAVGGDIMEFVRQLHRNGRLTASLVLRAVCMGDIRFLEASLAALCRLPLHKAQVLVHDEAGLGLASLYDQSGLSKRLYPAFQVAVRMVNETNYDGGPNDRARFGQRIVERVLTRVAEADANMAQDDIDYLLGKLDTFIAQARA
jgi:uncharacterized protein (DUF2336 family)